MKRQVLLQSKSKTVLKADDIQIISDNCANTERKSHEPISSPNASTFNKADRVFKYCNHIQMILTPRELKKYCLHEGGKL